ncbi:transmembrane protein 14C isoform X1 [Colossoma macropomum]|uniref:transmembrane protein 14C isoform X1 n=2 Tax=Colossoma macropomum TaxID=42526 RepID=UPI0018649923|nr:transmembrane protein 14C isoform X1 [Colossoma macropomum]
MQVFKRSGCQGSTSLSDLTVMNATAVTAVIVFFKQALVMAVDWAGYGYAALVASGGVLGYVKAGSAPSLAAGLLFGGLAGFGAYQISQDPKNIWVSLATSGTLAAIMGKRFYNSRKIMPAGIVAGASILMLVKLGVGVLQKPQESG